jgi:RNA 2',3'-cyclic 3'-phosphodiesterase
MPEGVARKRRLFVGIELDERTRSRCAAVAAELRKSGFDARYEVPEKLHVTLAVLGFVEASRVDDVVCDLPVSGAGSAPFEVTLDKLGAFPHERKPRVVYIGAREQGACFRQLAESVRRTYAGRGFEFEQDPVAHVTIARVKETRRSLPLIEFPSITLLVERLTLFESLPDRAASTSRYVALETAPLRRSR